MQLINIFTGQHASPETQKQLTEVKQIGLSEALTSRQTNASAVKLQTFQGDRKKVKKGKKKVSLGKSEEVAALLRMTQITAIGGTPDILDYIGRHECSKKPPSLFEDDGHMRTGTKSTLVRVLREDTGVHSTVM